MPDLKISQLNAGPGLSGLENIATEINANLNFRYSADQVKDFVLSNFYAQTAVDLTTSGQTLIGVTDTSVPRTITLASVDAIAGRIIRIKDESLAAEVNNITIATQGGKTIDGTPSAAIYARGGCITIYSDGTNWFTIPLNFTRSINDIRFGFNSGSFGSRDFLFNTNTQRLKSVSVINGEDNLALAQHSSSTSGAVINLVKSRGGSEASPTAILSGDVLWNVEGYAYDGANYITGSRISCVSTNIVPATKMTFSTRSSGSGLLPALDLEDDQTVTFPQCFQAKVKNSAVSTVTDREFFIGMTNAVGGVTVTLSSNQEVTGRPITIKDSRGTAGPGNNITVLPHGTSSALIDGAGTLVLGSSYAKVTLVFDGTDYNTV